MGANQGPNKAIVRMTTTSAKPNMAPRFFFIRSHASSHSPRLRSAIASLQSHFRVYNAVQQINNQVGQNEHHGGKEYGSLNHREIPF